MTTPIGGVRARLIKIAVQTTVRDTLDVFGWLDATVHDTVETTGRAPGTRKHRPVTFYTKRVPWSEPLELNAVVVAGQDVDDSDMELGSNLTEDRWFYFVDVYGESDAVAEHIAHDIRDSLRGKMPSIGRDGPYIDVLDTRMATPVPFTRLQIVEVTVDRARFSERAWDAHWWSIGFVLEDELGDEDD